MWIENTPSLYDADRKLVASAMPGNLDIPLDTCTVEQLPSVKAVKHDRVNHLMRGMVRYDLAEPWDGPLTPPTSTWTTTWPTAVAARA